MSLLWFVPPYVYGVIAGCLELLSYSSSLFWMWLSSFATLPLMICGYAKGWQKGLMAVVVASVVGALILLVKKDIAGDLPLLRIAVVTPLKFLIPTAMGATLAMIRTLASSTEQKNQRKSLILYNQAIVNKTVNSLGVMALLLLLLVTTILAVDVGIEKIIAGLRDIVTHQSTSTLTTHELLERYLIIIDLLPGLEIGDFMRSLTLQALALTGVAMWHARTFATWKTMLGGLRLERFWLPLLAVFFFGTMLPFAAAWAYFCLNAIFLILFLFLVSGSDIVYRHLKARRVPDSYSAVLFIISLAFGFPLVIFLILGFVDQFYSLKPKY